MKLGLLLNAVNPKIGGILVRGEKGTAKSTAARALAHLLPEVPIVADCRFSCDPTRPATWCDECRDRVDQGSSLETKHRHVQLIELPVSATEDRVVGTLDIEHAVTEGKRRFESGLLASANRGILYVDEVNLLSDHLVDVLLDAAAMGVNYVEREGISISHPAEFILIGTMNPEEGELRPQLLDRFALTAEVEGIHEPHLRAEVVKRRAAFESDPIAFNVLWQDMEEGERQRVEQARTLLPEVILSDQMLDLITRICSDLQVDGLRADIVMYKTAMTHCAYDGRTEVNMDDIRVAAMLALPHRRRRQPFDDTGNDPGDLERRVQSQISQAEAENNEGALNPMSEPASDNASDEQAGQGEAPRVDQPGATFRVRKFAANINPPKERQRLGRRTSVTNTEPVGRYVRGAIPEERPHSLALDATVRAAAPFQKERREAATDGRILQLRTWDIREKVRERRLSNLIVFVLDTSGSMGVENHMVMTKGAILSLLTDAYQKRDRIALVTFHGTGAEILLEPTNSVQRAERILRHLPTGGRTPLADGLRIAGDLLSKERDRDSAVLPVLIVVSDGRANVALHGSDPIEDVKQMAAKIRELKVNSLVVDTEAEHFRIGLASRLAEWLGGPCYRIDQLDAHTASSMVRQATGRG
ncbi:MAG: VWA domain-containing protein [Chloroflexi bacterium]|nr:VWA domain-containing protein [Chloroflexota bacterium]